jgi:hypothetical protein
MSYEMKGVYRGLTVRLTSHVDKPCFSCPVAINLMLGYYVYVEMRAFNVVITGADRTAKLPGYERALFGADTSDDEVEAHVRRKAITDLVDKIDDLGQTIRLLIQHSSSSGHITPGTYPQLSGRLLPFQLRRVLIGLCSWSFWSSANHSLCSRSQIRSHW